MKTGLVSIIIPVRFRPDLLRICLDILFKYTTIPFELIFVQEGDEPGVKECLESYKHKTIVYHSEPLGYPKAINDGYRQVSSDAEYVMFLNSDTVPTIGWLEEMMKCFNLDEKVGMVVPMLTAWGGIQAIDNADKMGDHIFIDEAVGVCMLLKKSVCDELIVNNEKMKVQGTGILDEMYEMGGGDDQDICMRLKLLGYEIINSRKAFIYHYISASFRKLFDEDIDYSKKYAVHVFSKFQEKFKKELGHKPAIFLSIPCANGLIHHELALRLIQWSHDPNIRLKIQFYPNLAPLDNARNRAVKDFLEDYWDYFMHIDDDIVPPVNAIQELIAADKEIIAPLCFTMHQDDKGLWFPIIVAHRYNKDGKYEPYYGKGIEETDTITGGCHLVKREVMEKLERPYYFTYHKNGLVEYSEDFVFSQQCQKLGYKLYTDYDLHCKHIRLVDVKSINDLMAKYGR